MQQDFNPRGKAKMAEGSGGVEEQFVLVDGMRMHSCRAGSGPAVVMLHGLVGSAKNWRGNMLELAREATVYALDLPNMGESERVAGVDAGLRATADCVAAWMDAMGLDAADIVAHSHGGAIALMLASRHPERVKRLVLFAPANPFCDSGRNLIRFYRTRAGGWLARRIPVMPRALHELALGRMYGDARRVKKGSIEAYVGNFNVASVEHVLRIVQGWGDDMKALLQALGRVIEIPVLLIWGDRDRAVSLGSSVPLQGLLPQSSLMVIPGAGHLPFEETPEICNRAMLGWLRDGEVPAEAMRWSEAKVPVWERKAIQA